MKSRVVFAESKLKKAYDRLGLKAEFVPIEGATHRLRRTDGSPAGMSQQQIYARIYDFFQRMFLRR